MGVSSCAVIIMATVSLIRPSLTLIFLISVTTATVDIYQDDSVCGGMNAVVECTTTTLSGFLEWRINNGPMEEHTFTTGALVNDNETVNGNLFVLKSHTIVSGGDVYTSTATVNTLNVMSVQCSDGADRPSQTIRIQVDVTVNFTTVSESDTSIVVSWAPPPSAGVCCERYHVRTSDETSPTTTMTSSYTLNITTLQQRQAAFIIVHCLDQLGTMGPGAFFKPDITITDPPAPPAPPSTRPPIPVLPDDPCSDSTVIYIANVPSFTSCIITNTVPDSVQAINDNVENGVARWRSDTGLESFTAFIRCDGNNYPVRFDKSIYTDNCVIPILRTLFVVFCSLFVFLVVVVVVFVVTAPPSGYLYFKLKKKSKPKNAVSNEDAVRYQNEQEEGDIIKAL